MKQGIYEQLIITITRQEISALDPDVYNIGTEKLDAEEARKLLSTYWAAVTRRALKIVREQTEDKTAVLAQIRTCNEIIATLKGTLGEEEYNELQLDEQGEVLTHVYSKLNSIRAVRDTKIVRPDTPIAQSSLFTGAKSEPSYVTGVAKRDRDSRSDRLVGVIYQIQRASPTSGSWSWNCKISRKKPNLVRASFISVKIGYKND